VRNGWSAARHGRVGGQAPSLSIRHFPDPHNRRLLPVCCPPPSHSCSATSARSAARFAPAPTAVDPRWPREWSSPGAWPGRREEAPPPKAANQAVGPRAGLTYGRAGAQRRRPAGRHDRRPAAAAELRRSRAALQLRRTMKPGRMSRLSFRPVSCRSCSGGKPCTAITRPACFSPPSRVSSKGQLCCLIRHRPSRYHRNRRYPRSRRNRRYRPNRRYHRNRPRRSGRRLGVIRLQLQAEPSRGSRRHDGSRTPP
jgi:hypothetical protein